MHDESGELDDIALLRSSEVEKRGAIIPEIEDRKPLIRYIGDLSDRKRVRDIYRWNAYHVCSDILTGKMMRVLQLDCNDSNDSFRIPSELTSLLSCEKRSEGFDLDWYSRGDVESPQFVENSSYNVPYYTWDRRSFTFEDTDDILARFHEHVAMLDEVCDLAKIWQSAAEFSDSDSLDAFSIKSMHEDSLGCKGSKSRMIMRKEAAKDYGIESMVDAYYSGVPMEDIIA